jgi:hypothetical protein
MVLLRDEYDTRAVIIAEIGGWCCEGLASAEGCLANNSNVIEPNVDELRCGFTI